MGKEYKLIHPIRLGDEVIPSVTLPEVLRAEHVEALELDLASTDEGWRFKLSGTQLINVISSVCKLPRAQARKLSFKDLAAIGAELQDFFEEFRPD